ncbi:hypothetical protein HDV05_005651 [Chytridiales sp. JEL 0842]|nr:hypothetical protein HDV05_005651 [Chytridiales sp. JEL 0842]
MIEVDVFWSFSFGAIFAAVAQADIAKLLAAGNPWWLNKYFIYNLLFLSLVFGPSGIYLLWEFPGWESMFVLGDKNTIHAILPTIFSLTNVALGIWGFYLTCMSIKTHGNNSTHHGYWVNAYTIFNAILGLGFRRFTYYGDHNDWAKDVYYPPYMFLKSEVFFTLLAMGVVLIPAAMIPGIKWASETLTASPNRMAEKQRWVGDVLFHVAYGYVLVVVVYMAVVLGFYSEERRNSFKFGWWAPLVGFTAAEVIVFGILFTPFLIVFAMESSKKRAAKKVK